MNMKRWLKASLRTAKENVLAVFAGRLPERERSGQPAPEVRVRITKAPAPAPAAAKPVATATSVIPRV